MAGTMYLLEGQFNIWWPNFGRQEVWQMSTKATVVDIVQPKFLRTFRICGNVLKNPPENQHAVSRHFENISFEDPP